MLLLDFKVPENNEDFFGLMLTIAQIDFIPEQILEDNIFKGFLKLKFSEESQISETNKFSKTGNETTNYMFFTGSICIYILFMFCLAIINELIINRVLIKIFKVKSFEWPKSEQKQKYEEKSEGSSSSSESSSSVSGSNRSKKSQEKRESKKKDVTSKSTEKEGGQREAESGIIGENPRKVKATEKVKEQVVKEKEVSSLSPLEEWL